MGAESGSGKRGVSPWLKFGLPVFVLVVVGAVLGGVLGSRAAKKNSDAATASGASAAASSAASAKLAVGRFALATNSEFMMPLYPSTTNSAAYSTPTSNPQSVLAYQKDPFAPSNPSPTTLRTDRPRLIAPQYKWAQLPSIIPQDPYLKGWNDTIFGNASAYAQLQPVQYHMDGASGILDNSREIKMRVKAFAYVYRMTNDTKWSDLAWREINNAMSSNFGPADDKWNSGHFLDVAEMSSAFGIAYDWLHEQFTQDQKSQMRAALIKYGLQPGVAAFTDSSVSFGWWRTNIQGNWNCVNNAGLTLASLAILGDQGFNDNGDSLASQLLGLTIDNAKGNCAQAVSTDGTWAETPNYWYFGTTAHAEMASALITATGSDYGLLDTNDNFKKTGDFHMYVTGSTSLFDYGDHGPNKFSTTANSMLLYSSHYNIPRYALFQREQRDAAEPWSMFWYDASLTGAFWDDLALDMFFDDGSDQWASMRSSWTNFDALYVGAKAGKNVNHQTHNDLDVGDFVLDAMGTRWAGEYGSADYLAPGYFSSDAQDSQRWMYYRKMTEGQNTLLIGQKNQNVGDAPSVKHDSSGTKQSGDTTVFSVPDGSTAYWVTDMTSAYNDSSSVKRGIRLLNNRRQMLVQDEVTSTDEVQWRMQTNATISVDQSSGQTATLTRDGKTLIATLPNAPSGAKFSVQDAKRLSGDPTPPAADQDNPGISVLSVVLPQGSANNGVTLMVVLSPQWGDGGPSDVVPGSVALDSWSLTSHK